MSNQTRCGPRSSCAPPRRRVGGDVLGVVAAGGALGALARYGLSVGLPTGHGGIGWATLACNLIGCLLIGGLMVVITDVTRPHRLVRPFLGVGVLGGFTTFSTYVTDAVELTVAHRPVAALAYLAGTLLGALVAVLTGAAATRPVLATITRARQGRDAARRSHS